jgi:hypothetical protein
MGSNRFIEVQAKIIHKGSNPFFASFRGKFGSTPKYEAFAKVTTGTDERRRHDG